MRERRLKIKERLETCAIEIPQDFIYYYSLLGVIPPGTKIITDLPLVWERLRPDIDAWVKANIRQRSLVHIRYEWIEVSEGTRYARLLVFGNPKDALFFKMRWIG